MFDSNEKKEEEKVLIRKKEDWHYKSAPQNPARKKAYSPPHIYDGFKNYQEEPR